LDRIKSGPIAKAAAACLVVVTVIVALAYSSYPAMEVTNLNFELESWELAGFNSISGTITLSVSGHGVFVPQNTSISISGLDDLQISVTVTPTQGPLPLLLQVTLTGTLVAFPTNLTTSLLLITVHGIWEPLGTTPSVHVQLTATETVQWTESYSWVWYPSPDTIAWWTWTPTPV